MKSKITALFLLLFSFVNGSDLDLFPVAYQGRIIPFKIYAETILSHLSPPENEPKTTFLIGLFALDHDSWDNDPLFSLSHKELRSHFPAKKVSYNQIQSAFETNADSLLAPVVASHIHKEKSNGKAYLELKTLAPGLWVKRSDQYFTIAQTPHTFPWNTLTKNQPITSQPAKSSYETALLTLIESVNLYTHIHNNPGYFHALPTKRSWISIDNLLDETPTLYGSDIKSELRNSYIEYLNGSRDTLGTALINAYKQIAGQPAQNGLKYPTLFQLRLELFYYQFPFTLTMVAFYLLACLALSFRRWGLFLLLLGFALHTADLAIRLYLMGKPPVTNMSETIIYVPWISVAVGMIIYFFKRERILLQSAAFLASILLALLPLFNLDVGIHNPQAVLNSQFWLSIHVMMVVASYGAFLLAGILGHLYLITRKDPLPSAILPTLYTGTILLITGTLLGGAWAAQSWGRFWDWDPKESWAFISSCVYLVIIHLHRFGKIQEKGLAMGAVMGMLAISFTWYGVNFLLGTGLHSYGFGTGGVNYYLTYVLAEFIFIIWYALPFENRRIDFSVNKEYAKYTQKNI